MADDWRVAVTLPDAGRVGRVAKAVRDAYRQHAARGGPGYGFAMSASGPSLFLYADTEDVARKAERLVREAVYKLQLYAEFSLDRWHPVAQEWQDVSPPMPESSEARAAEHQSLIDSQTEQSRATGRAGWQVRAELPSRREADELAERLRAEGSPVIRRWKYLVLGAENQDDAAALAEVIRQQAPVNTSVQVAENEFVLVDTGQSAAADVAAMFLFG